jgi:hypothetical protein
MYDKRNNLSDLVANDARDFFGEWVYETVIPRNVRLSEAPSHGVPVLDYDAKSAGALAYADLARELLRRDGPMGSPAGSQGGSQAGSPMESPMGSPMGSQVDRTGTAAAP